MNRQQTIVTSALVLALAAAGTAGWALDQEMRLQTKVDHLSAQASSAASDASQARLVAVEGQDGILAVRQSLGGEISRLSAKLDELMPNPLSNSGGLARERDLDDVRSSLDTLTSKYRDLCTTLTRTDLVVRC